ncbi:glycosyltransferase family 8 protein [Aerococcaceae bacterium DSM 111020]|nr:glycosyltransferase family 8 protein [Aerococcaceae bacterium DSM 111020]
MRKERTKMIELLFTLDDGYVEPLKVALLSIYLNNQEDSFRIWLIHQSLSKQTIQKINHMCDQFNFEFNAIKIEGSQWGNAPTEKRYPKEMYFRLLAGDYLPAFLKKVLYIDPDTLIINTLRPLWEKDLEGKMLAAASHVGLVDVTTPLNKLRLDLDHPYYNSGVLLIDLELARHNIHWQDISDILDKYGKFALLPDQDVLNYLYGDDILWIPEEYWNYDARFYHSYYARSKGEYDIHWVMKNTSILHFCGQPKPWNEKHSNRFTPLYLTYQNMLRFYN